MGIAHDSAIVNNYYSCLIRLIGGVYFTERNGTERNGTERNAGLFHGTDKCDRGTIILYYYKIIYIRICKVRNDKLYYYNT